jgi:hypothetical protein
VFTAESSLWAIMSLSVHPVYSQKKKTHPQFRMDDGAQLMDVEL